MKFNNYQTQIESIENLQKYAPEYAKRSMDDTFEGFSADRDHYLREVDLPENKNQVWPGLEKADTRPILNFGLTTLETKPIFYMRLFGDLSLSKDFSSMGSFDFTYEISVNRNKVTVQGPKMNTKLFELAMKHLDSVLLRASELNNHFWKELVQTSEMNSLDALTVLQYRYQGDELVNQYLSKTLSTDATLDILRRFTKQGTGYPFPLESQAIQLGFDQDAYIDLLMDAESRANTRHLAAKLRNTLKEKLDAMLQLFADDLQRILKGAPKGLLLTVYRGIKVENESQVKKSVSKGFISTSTNLTTALQFMGSCCLLTQEIPKTQPILHFSDAMTSILVQKVRKAYPKFDSDFFAELYEERLDEDEVLLMKSTAVEWVGLTAQIE